MKNLEYIADELFNKIRGRYPSVTVGDNEATITNMPAQGRFFEFDFQPGKKVSISLDEDGIAVMFSNKLFDSNDASLKSNWFSFLKELRTFAKKRMLNFDTRDITKNSLDKRDYEYLSTEKQMSESKLYGTSRTSFQDIGSAKMIVKHSQQINREQPAGRTRDIAGIYIESESGERFKYPMKHLNGARAMSMHVAEGGTPYDDFGKHIIGLSEELSKLRKFKTYMNRSSVMAEGLAGYMDVVNERIEAVKKSTHALQSKAKYKEAFDNFDNTVLEEVPEDVSNSWIDELTIRQFNEELKGVFPYIYRLVSEANKVQDLGPEDLIDEGKVKGYMMDMEDDAQDMDRREFMLKHGERNVDIWDKVNDEDYRDDSDFGEDQYSFEPQADAIVNGAKFNQEAPMTAEEQAFEDFKMAAANAAAKGEKEFEYPAGSGKKHPTKMNKATAAKLLADSQTNEGDKPTADQLMKIYKTKGEDALRVMMNMDQKRFSRMLTFAGGDVDALIQDYVGESDVKEAQLDEFAFLPLLIPAATTAARVLTPLAIKGGTKGAKAIMNWAKRNPVKATVATGVAGTDTGRSAVKGAYDTGKAIKGAVDGAGEVMDKAKDAIDKVGDKVVQTADDLKGMMPNVPNLDQLAAIGKQYALPAAVVAAVALGGYKVAQKLFGKDKEPVPQEGDDKDSTTIDISPKGQGDELKAPKETPLDEFVKSMYDYTQNAFPKGETAVLTAVQKKYGEKAVREAGQMIEELLSGQDEEMARIQHLAGLR
tara:strand:+ start:1016 stop:3304 length:2289 start_codon:yes stop_codon:yes gene_type:complete